jgi:phosphonate transport system substrate-binding protein
MITLRSALLAVLAVVAVVTGATAQETPLAFGILNQQSAALTAQRWNPILHYVTTRSGVPLRLKMGPTVQETDAMMGRGDFDFMFTNHNFRSEYDAVGYRVIAKWAGEAIRCVIAVPADSAITSVGQLAGKRVAFPSRDAFVGYAVPLVALRKAGVRVEEVFGANQEGVLAQLKARRVDAGAVNSRFLAQYSEREHVQFREIFVSDAYPELAVIVHPRVPAPVAARVRDALLAMKNDPGAAPVLGRANSKGFEPATDRDYEGVRTVYRLIKQ